MSWGGDELTFLRGHARSSTWMEATRTFRFRLVLLVVLAMLRSMRQIEATKPNGYMYTSIFLLDVDFS